MLIVESHVDVPTVVDGKESPMRELCPPFTSALVLTFVKASLSSRPPSRSILTRKSLLAPEITTQLIPS